jgi:cell division protein FtsI (penicillin-binding protein 3)
MSARERDGSLRDGSRESRSRGPDPVPRWRVWAVAVVLLAGLGGVALKAARLQLGRGDDLRGLAEDQYLRNVKVSAPRGEVLDRNGHPLAVSVPAWSVFAEPRRVDDKAHTAHALATALGIPEAEVASKLEGDKAFTWLVRRTSADAADAVRALDLQGIGLRKEMRRYYPNKAIAGQLLGGVNVDGEGRGGVEQLFDDALQGQATSLPSLADNKGDHIALTDDVDMGALDGDNVKLTLDLRIQHIADEAVADAVAAHSAKAGFGIVMDARTGGILAVANTPTWNPNGGNEEGAERRNRAFGDAFEPGSIFKVATFAAALEAGVVDPTEMIFCENGKMQLGKNIIHDAHKAGWLTATQVFAESSNIGTLKIGQRLGEDRFKEALTHFGFGKRLGTGLVEETSGRLPPQAHWGDMRLATASFGHGVLVSALQMLSLAQAVGNGGVRIKPHVLDRVELANGDVVKKGELESERLMSEKTAHTLRDIMKAVALEGGTGVMAAIPGVEVAGKTGTAEKVDPITHTYSKSLNLSSFVGFAPADDPRYVAIVIIDEPHNGVFGGMTAAPAWRRIVEQALVADGTLAAGDLAAIANPPLKKGHKAPAIDASAEGARVDDVTDTAALASTTENLDLRGLSAREAIARASALGLDVTLTGTGRVVTQDPAAGSQVPAGSTVHLTLAEALPGHVAVKDTP